MDTSEQQRFADEHPGWETWQSLIGGQWHARKKGSTPPMMLHDDTIHGLSEQVKALEAQDRVTATGRI